MENEVREGFYSWIRKELNGVVKGISGKMRFLVRFQYGCEKDLTSNQITIMVVEKIPVTEETELHMISVIPDETIYLENG